MFVFEAMGVDFTITVALSILLIWVYTFRGGIKTIIWTDTLQTMFMLISVGLSIYFISESLEFGLLDIYSKIEEAGMGEIWQTENAQASNYWIKGILAGMFITLGMTGVDQDMMQKNLTCSDIRSAKKNMISFSLVLFFVNILFVTLGGLLFLYIDANPDVADIWHTFDKEGKSQGDLLFATIALKSNIGFGVGVFFLLGLIAAAYSSADSALTSLTTSLSIDFLNISKDEKSKQEKKRMLAHILMSIALFLTIIIFRVVKSDEVVWELFNAANYTYGPLLGLFMFGILTKRSVRDFLTVPISLIVPILIYLLNKNSVYLFAGHSFGSELLGVNALLVFLFLFIFSKKKEGALKIN
jgi:Na+/proline symporter